MTIIDAHAHIGSRSIGNFDYYLRSMERSGVDRTILVAGDNIDPVRLADYIRGKEPLLSATPKNDVVKAAFMARPDRFWGFFTVDPEIHDIGDVRAALDDGFVGLKLNPLVHHINFRDDLVRSVFELSHQFHIPIYTHVALNPNASIELLREVVRETRPVVIIGHMGFAAGDWEALEVARDFDSVYMETSVGAYQTIKTAARVIGPAKLIFGSEGPAHHQFVELTKIRELGLNAHEEALILGENIFRLLGEVTSQSAS